MGCVVGVKRLVSALKIYLAKKFSATSPQTHVTCHVRISLSTTHLHVEMSIDIESRRYASIIGILLRYS